MMKIDFSRMCVQMYRFDSETKHKLHKFHYEFMDRFGMDDQH